ncbi:MAG: T9SS type A sorting domain-containing protein [Bacteroidetes bacterium]|nr:T9SS type A sorting domain-containing protein [Bacteroidota bacterium]
MKKIYIACIFLFLFMVNGLTANHANSSSNNKLSLVLTATVVQSNITCNGQCNGSATVIASGGASPYSYQWIPIPASTPSVNGLCGGSYTVIVTDASSATVAVVFTITQPPPMNLSSSASSSICPSACKTLTTNASGGTPPYTYAWQPGNINGSTITVCPSLATTYTVIANDSYSCSITKTITISITSTVANAGSTQSITCVNATAMLNGSGLSTYNWAGPGIISGATTSSPTVGSAGVYSLTGTNGGCSSNTATVMVFMNTVPPSITIASSSSTVCAGKSVTLTANTTANCTYSWSNGSNTPATVVSPTSSTSYTVVATNLSNGCQGSASQGIGVSPSPTVSANSATACVGATGCLNASGASTYTWTGPCGFNSLQASPCFAFNMGCACTFSVKGALANGCSNTATVCLAIIAPPAVSIMTSNSIICVGQTSTLTANGAITYTWSTNSSATNIAVSPTVNTSYTLTGTSGQGCPASVVYTQSVSACAGIKDAADNENDLIIYPNPSAGAIIININIPAGVVVYNGTGKEVLLGKLKAGTNNIDLSDQPKGIYFVKCGSVIKKVIKE